jgi:aminoglycoside phosphotransferase (APT) family kinase protein
VGWDHEGAELWPPPDDIEGDLNSDPGPAWLDDVAARARQALLSHAAPRVIGHGDWYSGNIEWIDRRLHAVHDWDSIVSQPEAAIAGQAAAVFSATDLPGESAGLEEVDLFLSAYAKARARRWTREEHAVAWAAGLWTLAFEAKKEWFLSRDGQLLTRLREELGDRVAMAGI